LQLFQQFALQLNTGAALFQALPGNEEIVLYPFPQGDDLGCVEMGVVLGQDNGDLVKQPRPVRRHNGEQVILAPLVRRDGHFRCNGEVLGVPGQPSPGGGFRRALGDEALGQLVLHDGRHFPGDFLFPHVQQDKAIQGVAVLGGVNLGIHDVVTRPAEKAAEPGEEIGLIRDVHHHLEGAGGGVFPMAQAGFDHRSFTVDAVMETAGVPGDFLRGMAQEIDGIQLLPKPLVHRVG